MNDEKFTSNEEPLKSAAEIAAERVENMHQDSPSPSIEPNPGSDNPGNPEQEDLLDQLKRAKADFLNYQRRTKEDMKRREWDGKAKVLRDIIPVLDNFERAVAATPESQLEDPIIQGFLLVRDELRQNIYKLGVSEVDAQGKPFDPTFHEAMFAEETTDHPPNTVMEVFEAGYLLEDTLLRPSRVRVSKQPAKPAKD